MSSAAKKEQPTYLTVQETAKYLRVSTDFVYREAGKRLPAIDVSTEPPGPGHKASWRFLREDLDAWMRARRRSWAEPAKDNPTH